MKKRFVLGKNDPVNDIYDAYENTESNSDTYYNDQIWRNSHTYYIEAEIK